MIFNEIIEHVTNAAIGGHMRPDGDCVGSCMGLYLYLKQNCPHIRVDVYLEEIPEPFRFIEDSHLIRHEVAEQAEYDVFIALDCGDAGRLGFAEGLFKRTKRTVCIDHHISNGGFADSNYVEPKASSTSELIYNLCDKDKITASAAACLYLGIVHDTGVFQYSNTSPETMEAAAELMRKGIDAAAIIQNTFYEKTYAQSRIQGYTFLNSRLYPEQKVIASVLTLSDLQRFGVTAKELDGIASQMRNTKEAETAVFIYQLSEDEYKVSLRSGNIVDVSIVAQHFGGGGHKKAAGFNIQGRAEEVIAAVMKQIERQMKKA